MYCAHTHNITATAEGHKNDKYFQVGTRIGLTEALGELPTSKILERWDKITTTR